MAKPTSKSPNQQGDSQSDIFWAVLWFSLGGLLLGAAVLLCFTWWITGKWLWDPTFSLSSSAWYDVARSTITSLGIFGLGGAALLAYRKQQTSEKQHQLDELKQQAAGQTDLRSRFTTAAEQLGHDKPAVRLAGVYALAALADDWHLAGNHTQRQVCVDVLCAYLRMEYDPTSERAKTGEKEVRWTVIRVITSHLQQPEQPSSWCGLNFDFSGAVFDGGSFAGAQFTEGDVDFQRAQFTGGLIDFRGACFTGASVNFSFAQFTGGDVNFTGTNFARGEMLFYRADFTSGNIDFSAAMFAGGHVVFSCAQFAGGAVDLSVKLTGTYVNFNNAELTNSDVNFTGLEITGGSVTFNKAKFLGGRLIFSYILFDGGTVTFHEAKFLGGEVDFTGAQFAKGNIDFREAEFHRGILDFRTAEFIGGTVGFEGVSGNIDARVTFEDPGAWRIPPLVPWHAGSTPIWVRPNPWPSVDSQASDTESALR